VAAETGLPCRSAATWSVATWVSHHRQIARDLRSSIEYGLAHRRPALEHAKQFNRGIGDERTDTFVGMYVNEWTVDYGPRGRAAVQLLLDRAFAAGLVPERVEAEFVG
jgi:1,4-dihydroxy-6-naphthoate synthase